MRKSRWIALAVLALAAVAALAFGFRKRGYSTYAGTGYSIEYPTTWRAASFPMVDVAFLAPSGERALAFQPNVNIVLAMPMSETGTEKDLIQAVIHKLDQPENRFRLIKTGSLTANRQQVPFVQYTMHSNGFDVMVTTSIVNGNRSYVISYTTLTADHELYAEAARRMVESFSTQ